MSVENINKIYVKDCKTSEVVIFNLYYRFLGKSDLESDKYKDVFVRSANGYDMKVAKIFYNNKIVFYEFDYHTRLIIAMNCIFNDIFSDINVHSKFLVCAVYNNRVMKYINDNGKIIKL